MAETKNLSWSASADKPWIHLSQDSGSGNATITVTTDPTTDASDSNGTITIKCDDCGENDITISVTRCIEDCEYENTGTTEYTEVTITVGKCFVGDTGFTVPYTTTYKSTNGCDDRKVDGSSAITVNVAEVNDTESERIISSVTGVYTVKQEAGPCTTCDCDMLTVTGKTCDSNGGSDILVMEYATGTCWNVTGATAEAGKNWITITSYDNGKVKATVEEYSDISEDRTVSITINAVYNNQTCSKTVTFTQTKRGCAGYTITANPTTITCDGGTVTFTANPKQ